MVVAFANGALRAIESQLIAERIADLARTPFGTSAVTILPGGGVRRMGRWETGSLFQKRCRSEIPNQATPDRRRAVLP